MLICKNLFKNDSYDFIIAEKVVGEDTDHGGSPRLASPPTRTDLHGRCFTNHNGSPRLVSPPTKTDLHD